MKRSWPLLSLPKLRRRGSADFSRNVCLEREYNRACRRGFAKEEEDDEEERDDD